MLMESCEVLIVGGGPAGASCARELRLAGLDVLLLDKEQFPRPKSCAGWITPAVLAALAIRPEQYRQGRLLQEINGFRTGLIGGTELVTSYGKTVSYGIRRSEFDAYLLERSGVPLRLGEPAVKIERQSGGWLVNGRLRARLLVGAGGHYCPVARQLGARLGGEPVIAAQVAEFALTPEQERSCQIPAETPALFFCRDMKGYGWLLRKGGYLNVGLGRQDQANLPQHTAAFCRFLVERGHLPAGVSGRFQGHAYLLYEQQGRQRVADGALLIGDAAGLAQPQSGEGILPAIESAQLAAQTIIAARGVYRRANLDLYPASLAARFGGSPAVPATPLISGPLRFIGARLLASRWFTRHVVLDRWFLHAEEGKGHRPLNPCSQLFDQ